MVLHMSGAEMKPRQSLQGRKCAPPPGAGMCVTSHNLATGISSAFHLHPGSRSVCNILLTQAAETTVHTSEVRRSPPCA